MNKLFWWIILWTVLSVTWCDWVSSRWKHDEVLKHSNVENSKYRDRIWIEDKVQLVYDHNNISRWYKPYELEIENECTLKQWIEQEWERKAQITIEVEWNTKEDQALKSIIEQNLNLYDWSMFREKLVIRAISDKSYKQEKQPWIWVASKKLKWKYKWSIEIVLNKSKYNSWLLHHELIHYFQFQISDDLWSVNKVIDVVNSKYLNVMKLWESQSDLFISDYSTKESWEDAATIHESFMRWDSIFIDKLMRSSWLREKFETFYWVKIDMKHLMSRNNFDRFWTKEIILTWDMSQWEFYKLTWLKINWNDTWMNMFKEIDYKTLNQIQRIKTRIWDCIVNEVSEKDQIERARNPEKYRRDWKY